MKKVWKWVMVGGVPMLMLVEQAHAAVDTAVTAGFTSLAADAATLGGLAAAGAVGITLLGAGIVLAVKFLKKGVRG